MDFHSLAARPAPLSSAKWGGICRPRRRFSGRTWRLSRRLLCPQSPNNPAHARLGRRLHLICQALAVRPCRSNGSTDRNGWASVRSRGGSAVRVGPAIVRGRARTGPPGTVGPRSAGSYRGNQGVGTVGAVGVVRGTGRTLRRTILAAHAARCNVRWCGGTGRLPGMGEVGTSGDNPNMSVIIAP